MLLLLLLLPGSGGALSGSKQVRDEESSSVVATGRDAVGFGQQKTVQKGHSVKELGERHLLLFGGSTELREDTTQALRDILQRHSVIWCRWVIWHSILSYIIFTLCRVFKGDFQLLSIV